MPQVKQVYEQLGKLHAQLQELQRHVFQERNDIVELDIEALEAHRARSEEVYMTVRALSEQVASQIKAVCKFLCVTSDVTLTNVIDALPKPDRESFVELQSKIRTLAIEIESALAVNSALLHDSIAFANQSLLMFTTMLKGSSNTYGQAGRFIEKTNERPRIICKEI